MAFIDSPYVFTIYQDASLPTKGVALGTLPSQLLTDLTTLNNLLGGGLWVRYQFRWKFYEWNPSTAVTEPPTNTPQYYDGYPQVNPTQTGQAWSAVQTMDAAVQAFNSINVNVMLTVQDAPANYLIYDDSGTQVGISTGTLAGPQAYKRFAQRLAQRYDGNHGHGHIEAIQIGNEEFDTVAGRTGAALPAVANAAIPAVRTINPALLVGVCSVRKTPSNSSAHITSWMNTVAGGISASAYPDFFDFHAYYDGRLSPDPTSTVDTTGVSVSQELTLIGNAIASHAPSGHTTTPIYCLETGWNIGDIVGNPAQLLQTTLQTAISASATTPISINLGSASGLPTSNFYLIIKNEWVHCSARVGATCTIDQRNIEKDTAGSSNLTHVTGETVQWAVQMTDTLRAPYYTSMFEALRTQNPNPTGKLGIWTLDYQTPLQAASVSSTLGTGAGTSWKAITDYMTAHQSWLTVTPKSFMANMQTRFKVRTRLGANMQTNFFITPAVYKPPAKIINATATKGTIKATATKGTINAREATGGS